MGTEEAKQGGGWSEGHSRPLYSIIHHLPLRARQCAQSWVFMGEENTQHLPCGPHSTRILTQILTFLLYPKQSGPALLSPALLQLTPSCQLHWTSSGSWNDLHPSDHQALSMQLCSIFPPHLCLVKPTHPPETLGVKWLRCWIPKPEGLGSDPYPATY